MGSGYPHAEMATTRKRATHRRSTSPRARTAKIRNAFLQELNQHIGTWTEAAVDALCKRPGRSGLSSAKTARVVREHMLGLVHSVLVTIDGGTALSDHGRLIQLTDMKGTPIGEGLHEFLFSASDCTGSA
jgi:hypothetical protein